MNQKILLTILSTASLLVLSPTAGAWSMKKGPLMTRWAAQVDPAHPLPEYPRPQLVRGDWLNLNGVWEYQPGNEADAVPAGKKLSSEILVPFPVESAISGVMELHDRLWYRRMFTVPPVWQGKQIILHFGAVDYESEVFVNGKSVGVHKGGYDPFSYDITPFLKPAGPQELIVRVFDPTNGGGQPRGKQSLRPGGIMYTPTTGIWQTVWLEPVANGAVKDLKITPEVSTGAVKVTVNTYGTADGDKVTVTAKDGGKIVQSAEGTPGTELMIEIPNAKLWSPDSPFLYDLQVSVSRGGKVIDQVSSYFGMRTVEIADVNGVKRMMLNGKFVFQLGPLDQGFWPDGLYTQPTEAALKYDIQMMKDLGFNMVRKHIKVEPARWYYWTDKLGLLVWQDMPSANSYDDHPTPPVDAAEYKSELTRIVNHLYNTPSIIQWETFNEGQGLHDAPALVALVKQLDPTRLVDEDSGGPQTGAGDLHDIHPYPAPNFPEPSKTQALVCGEYGGIGLAIPGHMWKPAAATYTSVSSPEDLVTLYAEYIEMLKNFRDQHGLSAAVYTQITDVETEQNGLLTYDRIPKMDVKEIAKANHFAYPNPTYTAISPTSEKESQVWKYTMEQPAKNWMEKTFDDSAWTEGAGGFGAPGPPNIGLIGTVWTTPEIWMRRTFNPGPLTADQIAKLVIRDYHDEDVEVYINGVLAYKADGNLVRYENRGLTAEGRKAIVPNADNVLAVKCRQTVGGQYIDVGLSIREPGK